MLITQLSTTIAVIFLNVGFVTCYAAPEQTTRVAIFGDTAVNSNTHKVLSLVKEEGADVAIIAGDLGYDEGTPKEWLDQFDDILGSGFPIIAVAGNHEGKNWITYQDLLETRSKKTGIHCDGEYGEKSVCRIGTVTVIGVSPGVDDSPGDINPDDDYATYIKNQLDKSSGITFCAWHLNQEKMQVGEKDDEAGWGVYESCREGGGVIITGHEHSYSRTHLLSDMRHQTIASTSNDMYVTKGETLVIVSGLGGKNIRKQKREGDWWASIYTSDQHADYGALFCDVGSTRASCYFKAVNGDIPDQFTIILKSTS